MKCVVLHVLVTLSVILQVQAAAAVLIAGLADIVTAARHGHRDLVLLHLIADPASANQRNDEYTTLPYKIFAQIAFIMFCFVCNVLNLVFTVEEALCVRLLIGVTLGDQNYVALWNG